jgi:hypothetical protein
VAACPYVEVSCPFADAGCAFRAARRDMGAHSSDMGAHLLILMTSHEAVKGIITVLETECASGKIDTGSLQRYVSILQASGDAAGEIEWVSSRTIPGDIYEEFTYTGQMRGGKFHGFGRVSWTKSEVWSCDGQWREGMSHGHANMKWRDGRSYEGN